MHHAGIDKSIIDAILAIVGERRTSVADMSLEEIATSLGISRMTLYRKIGSRNALHAALRAAGHDPGERPDARERALDATAALIRDAGVGPLTMEQVATEADCSLPTLFAIFGNRRSLLMEMFARHLDVPQIGSAFPDVPAGDPDALRHAVREVYCTMMAILEPELPILRALIAEALRDPASDAGAYITERHVPAIFEHIVPWFASMLDRGVIRDVPLAIAIQQFLGPIAAYIGMRPMLESLALAPVPNRDAACDLLADQFCRAMAPAGDGERGRRNG